MKRLRVLIAFEQSGRMRRAFAERGHDAWSIDLHRAWDGSNRHIIGDVRDHLHDGWDLLAVMHPPCTRLCNSGVRWLHQPPRGRTRAEMWADLEEACNLVATCWGAPIPRKALENPVMNPHAKARLPMLPKPQIVQPWWFGEPFFKATGFYLDGLPPLVPTNRLTPPLAGTDAHKAWSRVHRMPPGPRRAIERAATFPGLAEACADQWGGWAQEQEAAA
jgi:hypothetical protein